MLVVRFSNFSTFSDNLNVQLPPNYYVNDTDKALSRKEIFTEILIEI